MGASGQLAALHKTDESGVGLTLLLDIEPFPLPICPSDSVPIFQVRFDKCLVQLG